MSPSTFNPGFRLSGFDCVILGIGLSGSVVIGLQIWWLGMTVAFVVLHFFLFCNVFRISRIPEAIWAAVFVALAGSTIAADVPGWLATALVSLALSTVLIWRETKRPAYHGLGWKRWNPGLPGWWKARGAAADRSCWGSARHLRPAGRQSAAGG